MPNRGFKTWAAGLGVTAVLVAALGSAAASNVGGAAADPQVVVQATGEAARVQERAEQEQVVTVTGLVSSSPDAEGDTGYTITVDGQVIRLGAGPRWFYGDTYPLDPFVGKTVTVTGEQGGNGPKQGKGKGNRPVKPRSTGPEIDVFTVTLNGQTTVIRAAGKPPWAGGPKTVGSRHPGHGKGRAGR